MDKEKAEFNDENVGLVLSFLKRCPNETSKTLEIAKHVGGKDKSKVYVNRLLYEMEKKDLICNINAGNTPMWQLTKVHSDSDSGIGGSIAENSKKGSSHREISKARSSHDDSNIRRSTAELATVSSSGKIPQSQAGKSLHFTTKPSGPTVDSHVEAATHPSLTNLHQVQSEEHEQTNVGDDKAGVKETMSPSRVLTHDYEILGKLGKGGYGAVYKVKRKTMDEQQYALKIIKLVNSASVKDKMVNEVKIMASLKHRYILHYYNSWFDESCPCWDGSVNGTQEITTPETVGCTRSVDVTLAHMSSGSTEISSGRHTETQQETDGSMSDDSVVCFHRGSVNLHQDNASATSLESAETSTPKRSWKKQPLENHTYTYMYIVMELCKPETLRDWMDVRRTADQRPKDEIIKIFKSVVKAVHYLHTVKNFMHRDIKPQNILFDEEHEVKISDFGLATVIHNICESSDEDESAMLEHTMNKGTELYMAPEQKKIKDYDAKVDIYALGILFIELCCPFYTVMERVSSIKKLRSLDPEFPTNCPPFICDSLDFVKRMLCHNPSDRPNTTAILKFIKDLHS